MAASDEPALRGSQRRDAIGQAAMAVLARDGLAGLSMQAVARASGLAKSVVVYHVRDRQGLLTLTAETVFAARQALEQTTFQAEGDPRQHLSHWLNQQFDAAESDDSPIRLAWLLQLDREPRHARAAATDYGRSWTYRLSQLLARGHAQACWHAPDALRLATAVRAMTDGYLLQMLATSEKQNEIKRLRAACRGAVMDLLVR